MAYAERRERKKGVRYRGIYKAADGRYRSAGTFSTEERALAVALEAERHAAEVAGGTAGGLDPGTRATRTIKEYAPLFLRHHQVEGNTKDTYADTLRLHVIPFLGGCRLAETDRTVARNYITALQEEGRSANTIRQAKVVLGAMFGMAVADGYLDYNPFHDVKIPKVPGRRAIKIATPEQYLKVQGACRPSQPGCSRRCWCRAGSGSARRSGCSPPTSISRRASWRWPGRWSRCPASIIRRARRSWCGTTPRMARHVDSSSTGRGRARAWIRGRVRHRLDGCALPS